MENYADILFQGAVRDLQDADGTGAKYAAVYPSRTADALSEDERRFLTDRESIYIASVSETGWPYVQHRGGPRGFLKVSGPAQLSFADYRGNRQYITTGHVQHDNRVALFAMDYANKARLKLLGRMNVTPIADATPDQISAVETQGAGRVERIVTVDIIARDWNCPQFIPDLFPADVVRAVAAQATQELVQENARLKAELDAAQAGR